MVLLDTFHVYLLPNTNTQFCGEYLLQVTASSIILSEPYGLMRPLITWKLNTLRSYGRDEGKFTFEAGRLVRPIKWFKLNSHKTHVIFVESFCFRLVEMSFVADSLIKNTLT